MNDRIKRKEDFLGFITPINKRLWNPEEFYKRISCLEEKYDKDLCEFTDKELFELFNFEKFESYLAKERVFVSNYFDFCYLKEYTKTPNPFKRNNITLKKLIEINPHLSNDRVLYISKERYYEYLKEIDKAPNNTYFKAIVMAIYEGVLGDYCENLVYLSTKDINRKDNTIKLHTNKIISCSKELVLQLFAASNIDTITMKKQNLELYDILEIDAVFKTAGKAPRESDTLDKKMLSARRKFYKYINEYISLIVGNKDLNSKIIYISGMVNHVLGRLEENNQSLKHNADATKKYLEEFGVDISYEYFKSKYYRYINSYYDQKK